MEENRVKRLAARTKKLVEFSKKAPFFTSAVSLFYETTNVLYSELNYRMLFFSIAENEFGYPEIYNFEGKDLITKGGNCNCFSKAQILEFSQILDTFEQPVLLPKERITNWFNNAGLEPPEFIPETALTAPVKDRFNDKLGFMFICSEDSLDEDDLEFFANLADIVGTGLSNLENLENDDSILDDHVAHSPVGFLKVSDDLKILSVNDKFAQILGFEDAKDFLSDENQAFVNRLEHSRNLLKALLKVKNSPELSVQREMLAIDKFRNKRWLEIHARYHISDSFANTFYEVLVLDITDYKKIESEFTNLLILQDSLLNLSRDGITIEDENGVILGINKVLTKRYGKSADFLIGKHVSILGGEKRAIQENIQILQDGKPHIQTIEHLTPEGKRYYYELSEQLIRFPNGKKKIVSYARDVTKQVGKEQEIIKLKSVLRSYKEFQSILINSVAEKKTELFNILDKYNEILSQLVNFSYDKNQLPNLNSFKEEAVKDKITLDLITAIGFVFSDKENYRKSSFELNRFIEKTFFPRITKFLRTFYAKIVTDIKSEEFNLEAEKEVLLNLLLSVIESLYNNKSFPIINFTVADTKRGGRVIEIIIDADILSADLLGEIFTPPNSTNEFSVFIPQLFSLAGKTDVLLQPGNKTKIKIVIS